MNWSKPNEAQEDEFAVSFGAKFLDSQFTIQVRNDKFYLVDIGKKHDARVSVHGKPLQLTAGSVINIADDLHYLVDRLTLSE